MKTRKQIEEEVSRKGATNFNMVEVLLDIRDLLEKIFNKKNEK